LPSILIVGSITDGGLLGDIVAEVDACLHFAAIASVQRCALPWRDSHQVNQTGFINLLECVARRPGGRWPGPAQP
jgi:UDP-glucose 4-epimerase